MHDLRTKLRMRFAQQWSFHASAALAHSQSRSSKMARAMPVRRAGLDVSRCHLTLTDLGEDMFHNVAQFLAPKELLACSATSRHFRSACLDVSEPTRSCCPVDPNPCEEWRARLTVLTVCQRLQSGLIASAYAKTFVAPLLHPAAVTVDRAFDSGLSSPCSWCAPAARRIADGRSTRHDAAGY